MSGRDGRHTQGWNFQSRNQPGSGPRFNQQNQRFHPYRNQQPKGWHGQSYARPNHGTQSGGNQYGSRWPGHAPAPRPERPMSAVEQYEYAVNLNKLHEARIVSGLVADNSPEVRGWGAASVDPTAQGLPLTQLEREQQARVQERAMAYARLPPPEPPAPSFHRPYPAFGGHSPVQSGDPHHSGPFNVRNNQQSDRGDDRRGFGGDRSFLDLDSHDENQNQAVFRQSQPAPPRPNTAQNAPPPGLTHASLKRKMFDELSHSTAGLPKAVQLTSVVYSGIKFPPLPLRNVHRPLGKVQPPADFPTGEDRERAMEIEEGMAQLADFDCYEDELAEPQATEETIDEVKLLEMNLIADKHPDEEVDKLTKQLTLMSVKANPEVHSFVTRGSSITVLRASGASTALTDRKTNQAIQRFASQPSRWLSASTHMFPTCVEGNEVMNLVWWKYAEDMYNFIEKKVKALEKEATPKRRKPKAERERDERHLRCARILLEALAVTGGSYAVHSFMLRPLLGEKERVDELSKQRDALEGAAKKGKKPTKVARSITQRPDLVSCAACNVWAARDNLPEVGLRGLEAGLVWRIRRGDVGTTGQLVNLRFCADHTGAVIARDFCPVCLEIKIESNDEKTRGLYCRGLNGRERHFFHIDCAQSLNGALKCPHCGCMDSTHYGWERTETDWRRKSVMEPGMSKFMNSNKHHLTAALVHDRAASGHPFSADTTVAIWSPVEERGKTYLIQPNTGAAPAAAKVIQTSKKTKRTAKKFNTRKKLSAGNALKSPEDLEEEARQRTVYPVRRFFMPNLQFFFQERVIIPSSAGLLEKYTAAFISLSGERGGCLCREKCVPDSCPCMRWMGRERSYTSDGVLRFGSRLNPADFIRECNELCMCCMNSCSNRVTQMPSKVTAKIRPKFEGRTDGMFLRTCHPVKRGQFICRIGGTLAERVPEPDAAIPGCFVLPKFGLWPDEKSSLVIKDVKGLAKDFQKCNRNKASVLPSVVPVVVIQAPLSNLSNSCQQLAVPTVAFFAARNLPANAVLSYSEDFRAVNASAPQSIGIPKETSSPAVASGIVYQPLSPPSSLEKSVSREM